MMVLWQKHAAVCREFSRFDLTDRPLELWQVNRAGVDTRFDSPRYDVLRLAITRGSRCQRGLPASCVFEKRLLRPPGAIAGGSEDVFTGYASGALRARNSRCPTAQLPPSVIVIAPLNGPPELQLP